MNKLAITALVVSVMASGIVYADQDGGIIMFSGSVSDITCNISPESTDGENNLIKLGNMKSDDPASTPKTFKLVPTAGSDAGCATATTVTVSWQASGLGPKGIRSTGTSKDVAVQITPDVTEGITATPTTPITEGQGNQDTVFTGTGPITPSYSVKMVNISNGKAETGSVEASASYAIAYK
ncbi:MAG: hypothetical protein LBI71_00125 [Enterobacteriaceae bacterium]|jgi:type 1 fimbria pilin|nr:hypothetical protein [Enterobacteriaceae bacterium]